MDEGHVAAVVRADMHRWIRVMAALAKYQSCRLAPRYWAFRDSTGVYALFGILVLALLLLVAVSWWPIPLILALLFAIDVVVYSVSVAFVTQGPRVPFRTLVLSLTALAQVALAFAVIYRSLGPPATANPQWSVGVVTRSLGPIEALYFSVVTMATVGFGDIRPADGAWGPQLAVVCEILVALVFLACILTTVVSWLSGRPHLPKLSELLK